MRKKDTGRALRENEVMITKFPREGELTDVPKNLLLIVVESMFFPDTIYYYNNYYGKKY